jgi:hypothetical protein
MRFGNRRAFSLGRAKLILGTGLAQMSAWSGWKSSSRTEEDAGQRGLERRDQAPLKGRIPHGEPCAGGHCSAWAGPPTPQG